MSRSPGRWKAHAAAYWYAAEVCGVEVDRMAVLADVLAGS